MGGKPSRDKGARSERELVNIFRGYEIPAQRVPLSGATTFCKGDVQIEVSGDKWTIESKVRATGFKQIYGWLESPGIDALAIKADRQQTMIVLPLRKFCELIRHFSDEEGVIYVD